MCSSAFEGLRTLIPVANFSRIRFKDVWGLSPASKSLPLKLKVLTSDTHDMKSVSSTMLSRMMINLHKSIANSRGLVTDDNIPVIPAQSHSQHSDGSYGKEGKLMYFSAFDGSLSGTGYGQMGPVSTV